MTTLNTYNRISALLVGFGVGALGSLVFLIAVWP